MNKKRKRNKIKLKLMNKKGLRDNLKFHRKIRMLKRIQYVNELILKLIKSLLGVWGLGFGVWGLG